jgi:hypothetical protein
VQIVNVILKKLSQWGKAKVFSMAFDSNIEQVRLVQAFLYVSVKCVSSDGDCIKRGGGGCTVLYMTRSSYLVSNLLSSNHLTAKIMTNRIISHRKTDYLNYSNDMSK